MVCPHCGSKIVDNAVMCPNCDKFVDPRYMNNRKTEQRSRSNSGKADTPVQKVSSVKCKVCGANIPKAAKKCPYCGVRQKKRTALWVTLGVLLALFIIGSSGEDSKTPKKVDRTVQSATKKDMDTDTERSSNPVSAEPERSAPKINRSFDTSGYTNIDADVLFEYSAYLHGENVVTVITVDDVDDYSKMIKAKTSNNDGYFFSIVCEFSDESSIENVEEGDILTIAGTLEEKNEITETLTFLEAPTATLENCVIIGNGEIAADLKAASSEQIQACEEAKQAYERQIKEAQASSRSDYISQCETVKYSKVERNPDDYDGRKIKISGKVIQVSEGWFNSVTLRVDCGGNIWLVTYYRDDGESRILENDSITCYGECTGVTSYTTVLGSTVTVPSMDMEYYD